ncbi:hypothetical protein RvY_12710 [Ramazzottius varieornatus]|uniref:Uncharacterized protein n=1 Tax=Ramazzottius varieornatus TaxID=947166 RepID=A0A1D1VKE9_RAMVA|nr:hypothetical protein RvY_12710 [Ramazzottius varieornatus]
MRELCPDRSWLAVHPTGSTTELEQLHRSAFGMNIPKSIYSSASPPIVSGGKCARLTNFLPDKKLELRSHLKVHLSGQPVTTVPMKHKCDRLITFASSDEW